MARNSDTGLKEYSKGKWQCRIFRKINGVQYDKLCRIDERTGELLTTKKQARDYRDYVISQLQNPENQKPEIQDIKLSLVWEKYLEGEALTKAPNTAVKHKSVWKNHIQKAFGDRNISGENSITVQEINDFLSSKYYNTNLSYAYVEGFLKIFYLLYGMAYRFDFISLETLTKFTKTKGVRITMPQKTDEDEQEDGEISTYTDGEIADMAEIFRDTDLEPAFMLAISCGLRESEIFGLMWDDIDFDKKTITVNKQLIYTSGCWCISRVKTLTSNRVIDMSDDLYDFMLKRKRLTNRVKVDQGYKNRANEIVLDIRGKGKIEVVGADFVNRKIFDGMAGKLLTTNSIKYYSKVIKEKCGFKLKMHDLRKTHLTFLANSGYPLKSLMLRAGHKKLETSMKYYINQDETMREQGLRIINSFKIVDPVVQVQVDWGNGKKQTYDFKQSDIDRAVKKNQVK